jgi:hypothetical protein
MDDASRCERCRKGDGTKWEPGAHVVWTRGINYKDGERCRGDLVATYKDEGELVRPYRQKMC